MCINSVTAIYSDCDFSSWAVGIICKLSIIQERKNECFGTCRANTNWYGKRSSKRQTAQKRVGGEDQDNEMLDKIPPTMRTAQNKQFQSFSVPIPNVSKQHLARSQEYTYSYTLRHSKRLILHYVTPVSHQYTAIEINGFTPVEKEKKADGITNTYRSMGK
ncbi:hypothetical protein UY3_06339 [Chelonia mydas]|uniref:Uncharacterized protein n=1 Tax=Chelonia mydas TaxID=8469 RepID=M7BGY2_CHEMY|nr:hypothetical protein UY3_06339 [Chelonia mydas]